MLCHKSSTSWRGQEEGKIASRAVGYLSKLVQKVQSVPQLTTQFTGSAYFPRAKFSKSWSKCLLLGFERLLRFSFVEVFQDVILTAFAALNWKQDLLWDLAQSFMAHSCREEARKQQEKCSCLNSCVSSTRNILILLYLFSCYQDFGFPPVCEGAIQRYRRVMFIL